MRSLSRALCRQRITPGILPACRRGRQMDFRLHPPLIPEASKGAPVVKGPGFGLSDRSISPLDFVMEAKVSEPVSTVCASIFSVPQTRAR